MLKGGQRIDRDRKILYAYLVSNSSWTVLITTLLLTINSRKIPLPVSPFINLYNILLLTTPPLLYQFKLR